MNQHSARLNLIHGARKISAPTTTRGFYSGRAHRALFIPNNILFFCRQKESSISFGPMVGCRHHRFVLTINLETSGKVNVDKKTVRLEPGSATLIFPEQFHWFNGFASKKICWLLITFELESTSSLANLRDVAVPLSKRSLNDLQRMIEIWLNPKKDPRGNQLPYLLALFLESLTHQDFTPLASINLSQTDSSAHLLMQRINDFALSQLPHTIGIKQIADHLNISASHLRLLFRKASHTSLGHYLRSLRINRSLGYLYQGDLNISQIAAACGFKSSTAYSRAFNNIFKCPPLKYQKTSRSQNRS